MKWRHLLPRMCWDETRLCSGNKANYLGFLLRQSVALLPVPKDSPRLKKSVFVPMLSPSSLIRLEFGFACRCTPERCSDFSSKNSCSGCAAVFLQHFYMMFTFQNFRWFEVATACIVLASKFEDQKKDVKSICESAWEVYFGKRADLSANVCKQIFV